MHLSRSLYALVPIFLFAAAGCQFDDSALSDSTSLLDAELDASELDNPDIADTSEDPDTAPDTDTSEDPDVTPLCEPDEFMCNEDNVLFDCTDGGWTFVADCRLAEANCVPGALDCLCDVELQGCASIVCTPGELSCDGLDVLVCDDDGRGWSVADTCVEGQICADGLCEDAGCETPGETQCAGETLLTCTDDGEWDPVDCQAQEQFCDTTAAATCTDWVCTPDERVCVSAETAQACDARGSGWLPLESCDADAVCLDGTCTPYVCTEDELQCAEDGGSVERCADDRLGWDEDTLCGDGLSCLDATDDREATCQVCAEGATTCEAGGVSTCTAEGLWGDPVACAADETCEAGVCVENTCADGETRCEGDTLFACVGAEWDMGTDCQAGPGYCCDPSVTETCDPGASLPDTNTVAACYDPTCADGDTFCSADRRTRYVCDDRGFDWIAAACEADEVCEAGACAPLICTPDETRCVDDTDGNPREQCNTLGTAWELAPCADRRVCIAGACEPVVCDEDTIECIDEMTFRVCGALGIAWGPDVACDASEYCDRDAGACAPDICGPGDRTCTVDLRSAQVCNTWGSGYDAEPCAADEECLAGSCVAPVCGDGTIETSFETCEDGNTDLCDGCEGCVSQRALVFDNSTRSTDGTPWPIGDGDNFTFEFWIQTSDSDGQLLGYAPSNPDEGDEVRFWLEGGRVHFFLDLGGAADEVTLDGPVIDDGGWHHVAAERLTQRVVALYVDGEGVDAAPIPGSSNNMDSDGPLWIGCRDASGCAADATIDDVRLTNSVRYRPEFTPEQRLGADGAALYLDFNDPSFPDDEDTVSFGSESVRLIDAASTEDDCRYYGECGDGFHEVWEQCDDGNTANGDGCSARCEIEYDCGSWRSDGAGRCVDRSGRDDWSNRQGRCEDNGGDLVKIDTPAILAVVLVEAASENVWIGLNDRGIGNEGDYVWVSDDSSLQNSFRFWAPGEPNDGGFGVIEDCTELYTNGLWNDKDCNSERRGLCQRDAQ